MKSKREYLTFRLNQEEFGIDILKVQELRGYESPTRVADAPPFVKGVINLRGTIVPVVDLRIRFACPSVHYGGSTIVVVLNLSGRILGAVVDSVSDVVELAAESVQPAPALDTSIEQDAVVGLGSIGPRMVILLDIEKLMLSPSMAVSA
ncbi:MAG: chemotaxis protein CheW [Rhodoferax sp.]|nr:chemotaxis protein CheW [Rhodoferax sp.]